MKLLQTTRGSMVAIIALGGCLAFSGCVSNNTPSTQQSSSQEAPAEEQEPQTVAYEFTGISLEIPEYWKADSDASETESQLVFHSEDKRSTLLITREAIPQFMTIKAQGDSIVEATDEEVAESYIGISVMDSEKEQTVGEIEVVSSGDSSYMRKTFRGTANLANEGEMKAAQRNALVLLGDRSDYLRISVFCPEEEDARLSDADTLMTSVVNQV